MNEGKWPETKGGGGDGDAQAGALNLRAGELRKAVQSKFLGARVYHSRRYLTPALAPQP